MALAHAQTRRAALLSAPRALLDRRAPWPAAAAAGLVLQTRFAHWGKSYRDWDRTAKPYDHLPINSPEVAFRHGGAPSGTTAFGKKLRPTGFLPNLGPRTSPIKSWNDVAFVWDDGIAPQPVVYQRHHGVPLSYRDLMLLFGRLALFMVFIFVSVKSVHHILFARRPWEHQWAIDKSNEAENTEAHHMTHARPRKYHAPAVRFTSQGIVPAPIAQNLD